MPITRTIDTDCRWILYTIREPWTLDNILREIEDTLADPRYGPGMVSLVDQRAAGRAPTSSELRHWASFVERRHALLPRRRAALVGDDVYYGMNRVAAAMIDITGIELHPFREISEAVTWLLPDGGHCAERLTALLRSGPIGEAETKDCA